MILLHCSSRKVLRITRKRDSVGERYSSVIIFTRVPEWTVIRMVLDLDSATLEAPASSCYELPLADREDRESKVIDDRAAGHGNG